MMNRYFLDRILTLLHAHGLLDMLSDDVMQELSGHIYLGAILAILFPERYVYFDAECVYEDDVFEELVQCFAYATLGEWAPEHLRSTIENGSAIIDFDDQGGHEHWEFEQTSKWVSSAFTDAIAAFAETHLSGQFVLMPVIDQCYYGVYLPRAAAAEMERIKQEIRQEWPSSEELVFLLKEMVRKDHQGYSAWRYIRSQGNDFRFINTPTARGELPLRVMIEGAAQGSERALLLVKNLLTRGASPTLADGRGRTAFDAAAGNAAVLAVLKERYPGLRVRPEERLR